MRYWAAQHRGNPLYRTIDRVERTVIMVGVLAVLAVIPLAIHLSSAVHDAVRTDGERQAGIKSKVDATLVEDARSEPVAGEPGAKQFVAEASWQTNTGQTYRGVLDTGYDAKSGDTIPVWIDTSGKATSAPRTSADADVSAAMTGFGVITGAVLLIGIAVIVIRSRLNRTRMNQWDLQWALIEPVWSGRSKSA